VETVATIKTDTNRKKRGNSEWNSKIKEPTRLGGFFGFAKPFVRGILGEGWARWCRKNECGGDVEKLE
jgi:hypothetical protein